MVIVMNRAQAIYLSTEEVYRVTWRINGTSDIYPEGIHLFTIICLGVFG